MTPPSFGLQSPSSHSPTPINDILADSEVLHSSALTRTSCADIQRLLALSNTLLSSSTFPFSFTIDLSRRLASAWEAATSCPQCRHDRHALLLMPLLAEQAIGVYEAAGVTYDLVASLSSLPSVGDDDVEMGGGPGHTGSNKSATGRLSCVKSEMRLGELKLEGEEAELLARVALRRAVVKLGRSLEGLRALVSQLWGEGWAQRTETLRLVEERAGAVIERLVRLLGMLR